MRVLAGDVGGTNLRLALVDVPGGSSRPVIVDRLRVAVDEQAGVEAPINELLGKHGGTRPPTCIGVAGPIAGGQAQLTGVNMPWTIDARKVAAAVGLPRMTLVNDFHAAARGVEALGPDDLRWIGPGGAPRALPPGPGPRAILGAGSGLGQAAMVPAGGGMGRWAIVSSEGGHRDFGPRNPLEDRLLVHLRAEHGRVSTERVLSGPGLVAIYRFLVSDGDPSSPEVEAAEGAAVAPIVSSLGRSGAHPTCAKALALFVDVYGSEAGNVALTYVATGGVYVAGGIAPDLLVHGPQAAAFRSAFDGKGRFSDLLAKIPVAVVTTGDLGLLGAALEAAAG